MLDEDVGREPDSDSSTCPYLPHPAGTFLRPLDLPMALPLSHLCVRSVKANFECQLYQPFRPGDSWLLNLSNTVNNIYVFARSITKFQAK
jgi:hypothetical protein